MLTEFMLAPLWRGYDHDAYERQLGLPRVEHPLYAMQDAAWKTDHARPDGLIEPASGTDEPLLRATAARLATRTMPKGMTA